VCLQDPSFLSKAQILDYHREQISLFGGSDGLRDEGLLESAVSAPQNVYCYEENADIFDLSASYLNSLGKNHPFIDGNKRTAAHAAISFLKINGWELKMEPAHLTLLVESLVTGSCDQIYAADFMFIACCRDAEDLFAFESTAGVPPESFQRAKTDDERDAIIIDTVTAAFRAKLIDVCSSLMTRPSRFDASLDKLENAFFKRVNRKWRQQFGMSCEEE
jgi:death on curing protein